MKRLSVLLSLFLLFAALCPAALADGCWLEHSRNGYALVDPVSGTVLEYALSNRDSDPVVSRPAETEADPTK